MLAALALVSRPALASCLIWETTYNAPPADNLDSAQGVALDPSGNIVVAGFETRWDLAEGTNWIVRKYSVAGGLLWSRSLGGGGDESANAVAVGSDGRIYVAGSFNGTTWTVRGYDAQGGDLWSDAIPGVVNANAVAVLPDGGVVVAGGKPVWTVRKYSPAGAVVWTRTFADPGSANDEAHGIAVNPAGEIVTVGESMDDWQVRRYDPAGNLLGSFGYSSGPTLRDIATAVTYDGGGNLVIAGFDRHNMLSSGSDYWHVRKHTPQGALIWAQSPASVQPTLPEYSGGTVAHAVAVGTGGRIYVGGHREGKWVMLGLDGDGNEFWSDKPDGGAMESGGGNARGIAIASGGEIIAAGGGANLGADWRLRRYFDPATCPAAALRDAADTLLVYPNPVGGDSVKLAARLEFDAEEFTVDAYDVAMRRVMEGAWKGVSREEGGVTITGLAAWAPGMYFLKVRAKGPGGSKDFPLTRLVIRR